MLVVINIALLSGKQEFFQGVNFFLKSFSMGDFRKASPAQGLASKAGVRGKEGCQAETQKGEP